MTNVQFHIGEVIADPHSNTYVRNDSNQFVITVRTYTDFYDRKEIQALPFNSNIKQIPLVGEHVLLVQGISAENNESTIYPQWYYVSSFSLHSDINANFLQGVAPSNTPYVPKTSFQEKEVSLLQPYEGDTLIEGRFGNSIRLSSTLQGGSYSVQPGWTGSTNGAPIIILSNGKSIKKNSFIVEQIETDNSSLYLTSTQKINNLVLNNKLHIGRSESAFNKSQFIGVADRIILTAKTDIVALDSQMGIELLSPKLKIGIGPYEPMLQSAATIDAIQKIIQVIQSGFVDSSGAIRFDIRRISCLLFSRNISRCSRIH